MFEAFHPVTRDWFEARFSEPTEPQRYGWPDIRAGHDVLIAAPTGSGKTLSAFLLALDGLVKRAVAGDLPERTLVVYVSPLKALTNDVRKNLETPLGEMRALAEQRGLALDRIRTAVRTGDTTPAERAKMLRVAPHVLVTTPESLFILLTAQKSRALLSAVETVIVDEIHAVADDKRGAHLALTLARLDALVTDRGGAPPQRIGLSATVQPIATVARFLSSTARIVNVGNRRAMRLDVEHPSGELGPVASKEAWTQVYDRIAHLIREHRTTLVFVGTRRLAERVSYALTERLGAGAVLPHHGSLSRAARFAAEDRLKRGDLKAVVATASLELGIDIGSVDLAVQVGSPRSIAAALQRVGRSGHWVGALPHGTFFATTRDELVECAALVRALRGGEIDAIAIPQAPLDILAQHVVAACAAHDWDADALYAVVRQAYNYRDLTRAEFDAVIAMLADGIATSRGRSGAFLHYDRVNGKLRARRGARMAAITSGGAIPDTANYTVVVEPEGTAIGTVDEDFAVESMAGDIFLLGTTSWQIKRVEAGIVRVLDARGAPPSVPFWNGEGLGRTRELSQEVARLRSDIDERDDAAALALIERECGCSREGAGQIVDYVRAGKAVLGAVPTQRTVVAERFFDEAGGMQLIVHAPFGARINRAWGLALRKRFCRSFDVELQAAATDNGIVLSLTEQHAFPLDAIWSYLHAATVEDVLTQALLPAPMFAARWRWNATRALAILRMTGGKKVAPQIVRMRSDDLLAAVFPDQAACGENLSGPIRIPDHVLVRETIANCLHEAMDLEGLREVLRAIDAGDIETRAADTPQPSVFAHEILNANPYAFLDDAPLEERRARAVHLRSTVRGERDEPLGVLELAAIEEVARQAAAVVRDAEELHDALMSLVLVPAEEAWSAWFGELVRDRRATVLQAGGRAFWVAAERLELARLVHPSARVEPAVAVAASARAVPESREEAVVETLRGRLESSGPLTADDVCALFALDADAVGAALLRLESEGTVLRGRFRGSEEEWCNRRILARIHRLTLGRLRREIEPVSSADVMRFLLRWQHVAPGTRLHGVDGTLAVIRQLEGYEVPALAWETQILPRRIAGYKPEFLDRLCDAGEVMWGRLSARPNADADPEVRRTRRLRPTRLAPMALFLREHAAPLRTRNEPERAPLSHAAREVLGAIETLRAPFFAEIASETRRLPAEVEDALWELAAAGLVTADRFDALRSLFESKRRLGEQGRKARPRSATGRWALLPRSGDEEEPDATACARRLLARWGVVFRDLVAREPLLPPWRDVLRALRRMEAQGEVRGGRFVNGYAGEQFALPDALDALRAVRRNPPAGEEVSVAACDPLNLVGVILPGTRSAGNAAGSIRFVDGVPRESLPRDVRWLPQAVTAG